MMLLAYLGGKPADRMSAAEQQPVGEVEEESQFR